MKNRDAHILIVTGAMAFVAACGSLSTGGTTQDSAASSGTGSSATNGNANCGNTNEAVPFNPNQIDPGAYVYAYQDGANGSAGGSEGASVFVLTTDPNACSTGTLELKANQPTFAAPFSGSHGYGSGVLILDTTASVGNGECKLYGGDTNNTANIKGEITQTAQGYLYQLQVGSNPAYNGNLTVTQCNFPTTVAGTVTLDTNSLVSCASSSPNQIDPNAYRYGYIHAVNAPGQGSAAISSVVLSDNPNACDDGNLVLKANEVTFSGVYSQAHSFGSGTLQLDTTASVGNGECKLYGGDPNNTAQVKAGLTATSPTGAVQYSLQLGSNPAASGPVTLIQCQFPTTDQGSYTLDTNFLVPCTQ